MATEKETKKKKAPAKKKNLVIVESPAKAKTIEKMLGRNYVVTASFGHIRDLPKSKIGVDIEQKPEKGVPSGQALTGSLERPV